MWLARLFGLSALQHVKQFSSYSKSCARKSTGVMAQLNTKPAACCRWNPVFINTCGLLCYSMQDINGTLSCENQPTCVYIADSSETLANT